MGKRSTNAFALFGATALLFGGSAPALAAGTLSPSIGKRAGGGCTDLYTGKTSQRLPVNICRSGKTVIVDVQFKAKCKSSAVKKITGDVYGQGHVKGGKFSAKGKGTYPAKSGYTAKYRLKSAGKISSSKASGRFSVTNVLYKNGKTAGTCDTGKKTFKAHKE